MKNILLSLSIFSVAIGLVVSSWIISNSFNSEKEKQNQNQHELLTKSEVADYLGISVQDVQKLTKIPEGESMYSTEIPYIEIGNAVYYPKKAIDKWLLNTELTIVP